MNERSDRIAKELESQDRAEEYCRHGESLYRMEDFAGAEQAFQKALEVDPKSIVALNDLGVLHYSRGNLPQALDRFTTAFQLCPTYRKTVINLGRVLNKIGQSEQATDVLRSYVQQNPGDRQVLDLFPGLQS